MTSHVRTRLTYARAYACGAAILVAGCLLVAALPRTASAAWSQVGSLGALGQTDQMHAPTDVQVDEAHSRIYVSDTYNDRVLVYNLSGVYQSTIGSSGTGNGQFTTPRGMAVDASGDLYVVDSGNSRVEEFNASGAYVTQFGTNGAANGQFKTPWDVEIDSGGNLWVVDTGNNRIEEFNSTFVYQRKAAGLSKPEGIAADGSGHVYVADTGHNAVKEYSSTATLLSTFGSAGSGNGLFEAPAGIEQVGGSFYVADAGNNRIQEFNSSFTYLSQLGSAGEDTTRFDDPLGVSVGSSSGDVWVLDTLNDRLMHYNSALTYQSRIGTSGSGELTAPSFDAVAPDGSIYVSDAANHRVVQFSQTGTVLNSFGSLGTGNGQFDSPQGLAFASDGTVWVVDKQNARVEHFSAAGAYLGQFGSAGTGNGQFASPEGIAIDSSGNLWIVDSGNNRVEELNSSGVYQAQFGSAGVTNGLFHVPWGIAIAPDGTIWVVDTGDNRIQQFSAAGAYLAKSSGDGALGAPAGIAIASNGSIYVSNTNASDVEDLSSTGTFVATMGGLDPYGSSGKMDLPLGLAMSDANDLWVGELGNNRVAHWQIASVTISGTAMRAEDLTLPWADCNGFTPNVAAVVNGGPKTTVPCDPVTGAFSFSAIIVASDTLLTIYLDPSPVTSKGVTYVLAPNTGNVTGLEVVQNRVWLQSLTGTTMAPSTVDTYDADQDPAIPVTVSGGTFDTSAGDQLDIAAGTTFNPSGYDYSLGSLDLEGHWTSYNENIELTNTGIGACDLGPGLAMPLCIGLGGVMDYGDNEQRIFFDPALSGDIEIPPNPSQYNEVYTNMQPGSTAWLGTAPGQTIHIEELNVQSGTTSLDRFSPALSIDGPGALQDSELYVSPGATLWGTTPTTLVDEGGLDGAGLVYLPGVAVAMRSAQPNPSLGDGSTAQTPTWTLGSLAVSNTFAYYPGGFGAGGMTSRWNTSGANTDADTAVANNSDWGSGGSGVEQDTTVLGQAPANSGDFALRFVSWSGGDLVAPVTWDSGGADVAKALDAGGDGSGWAGGSSSGHWSVISFDNNLNVATSGFGSNSGAACTSVTGRICYDSGAGNDEVDAITSLSTYTDFTLVSGTVAPNSGDWMLREYKDDGTLATNGAATLSWPTGANATTEHLAAVCNGSGGGQEAYVVGTTSSNGGDWLVKRVDYNPTTGALSWDAGFGTQTYDSAPGLNLADSATSCVVGDDGTLYVAGNIGTNGGDIAVRAYDPSSGAPISTFGTNGLVTWNSGGATADHAWGLTATGGNLTVVGDEATNGSDWVMLRIDHDGVLDPTFGTNGLLTWNGGQGASIDVARSVDTFNGYLVVAGDSSNTSGGTDTVERAYDYAGDLVSAPGVNAVTHVEARNETTIRIENDLTVGNASDPEPTVLDLDSYNGNLDVGGSVDITSQGRLRASGSARLTVGGNWTDDDPAWFLNGGGTVRFDDPSRASVFSYTAPETFSGLSVAGAGKRLVLPATEQTNVTGPLALTGTSCAQPVELSSSSAGTPAALDATGTVSATDVSVVDANAVAPITTTSGFNGGGTSGWTFNAPGCAAPALTAPDTMFTDNANAASQSAHASGITSATPHMSWANESGVTVDRQRTQLYSDPLDSTVLGLWHFDTGVGTTADSSGNGLTLTANAAPTSPAGQAQFSQALGLNGTSQYDSVTSASLDVASNFTVDGWFKIGSAPAADSYIVEKGPSTAPDFGLYVANTSGKVKAIVDAGGTNTTVSSSTSYADGAWHYAALTVDSGDSMQLYVDGAPVGNAAALGGPVTGGMGSALAIGRYGTSSGGWFNGQIDDVRVSSVAHSPGDIEGYYLTQRPHGQLIWDSDPTDAGIALGSACGPAARCSDIVYGGAASDLILDGARYWARTKFEQQSTSTWTSWSDPDWFETATTTTVSIPSGSTVTLPAALPDSDSVATSTVDVQTSAVLGYTLEATSESDAYAMTTGETTLLSGLPLPSAAPGAWVAGNPLGFGLTVLSATGGKNGARWGPGSTPTDFANLDYTSLQRSTPALLFSRSSFSAGADAIVTSYRADVSGAQKPGTYTVHIQYTALPNV